MGKNTPTAARLTAQRTTDDVATGGAKIRMDALAPAWQLHQRSSRLRLRRRPCRAVAAASAAQPAPAPDGRGFRRLLLTLQREAWDAPPSSLQTFLALDLAAVVATAEQTRGGGQGVRLTRVDGHGLLLPKSFEEAKTRARANVVRFRQSYVFTSLLVALAASLRFPLLSLALASAFAAAVTSSDRLLGEAALMTQQRLRWNALRVGGLDRSLIKTSLKAAAVALGLAAVAASPPAIVSWALRSVLASVLLCSAHAVARPVDVAGAVASFVGDLAASKTADDAKAAVAAGIGSVWEALVKRAAQPQRPIPVVVVVRTDSGQDARREDGHAGGAALPPGRPMR